MVLTKFNTNIITAALLIVLNMVMYVFDKSGGLDRYINIFIPIIAFVFIFIFKNKNMYIFYTIVGVLITGFTSQANFSGSVLFFISMYDNKSKKNFTANIILIITAMCINAYRFNYLQAHIFSMMIAFFFVFSHMYSRFWNITDIKSKIGLNKGLTVEQIQTIEKLLEGKGHAQSAKELNIERPTFSARMGSIRKRYNVTNDLQLAISLIEDGVISLNSSTNVKSDNKTLHRDTFT